MGATLVEEQMDFVLVAAVRQEFILAMVEVQGGMEI